LLIDPVTGGALLDSFALNCLSRAEAYAEKFRAALSRREVAIRDFYDLDHAVRVMGLQPAADELVELGDRPSISPVGLIGPSRTGFCCY
jgi:hypothetical protein